jgi:CIC family chloride channel protein
VYETGIPVRSVVSVSHRVSRGIVDTAVEERANFIVLGREQHPSWAERVLSSVIDTVIREAPCEVAVLHGGLPSAGVRTVLIPFGENIHTRLALQIAPAICAYFRSDAKVVVVLDPERTEDARRIQLDKVNDLVRQSGLDAQVTTVAGKDVVEGVIDLARRADLLIMGGRSASFFGLLFGQSLTQEITARSACSVLWVREYEDNPSFWSGLVSRRAPEDEGSHG